MSTKTTSVLCKICGLTRGVAAAPARRLLRGRMGFRSESRRGDTAAFVSLAAFYAEATMLSAGGDQQALGDNSLAVF
jgi:hypothetical protein